MGKGAIIAVVSICVVVLIIFLIFVSISVGNVRENEYCTNWLANLEKQESEMGIFSDVDTFNKEVSDYNRQCAY